MSLAAVPNLVESGLAVIPKTFVEIANDISRFREPLHLASFPFNQKNRDGSSTHCLDQLSAMLSILLRVAKRDLETQRICRVEHPSAKWTTWVAVQRESLDMLGPLLLLRLPFSTLPDAPHR